VQHAKARLSSTGVEQHTHILKEAALKTWRRIVWYTGSSESLAPTYQIMHRHIEEGNKF